MIGDDTLSFRKFRTSASHGNFASVPLHNDKTSLQLTVVHRNICKASIVGFFRNYNSIKLLQKLRLSRTVLCISIPRRNGHRTAKRVKNTGTVGRSTGICGHTGQTTPSATCVCLLSASIAAAAPVAAVGLAGDRIANFVQKVISCELTAEAPIHVEARGT